MLAGLLNAHGIMAQSAEEILQAARMNPTARPALLRAQIRDEEKPIPLCISLKDRVIATRSQILRRRFS